ncbi:MAG: hypothetical protein M3463_05260 [Verrucomicrobiota bacterium]|nr:hypothetical protein [Verrucomicrobiota bacterium]
MKILLNSQPKAGTHLLRSLFRALPDLKPASFTLTHKVASQFSDPSSSHRLGIGNPRGIEEKALKQLLASLEGSMYVTGHVVFSETTMRLFEQQQVRMILILRDLRAIATSLLVYILRNKTHFLHGALSAYPSAEAGLIALINGVARREPNAPCCPSLSQQYQSIVGWSEWPGCCLAFFEHLVGEQGGGSNILQKAALVDLVQHLHISSNMDDVERATASIFDTRSPTFFRGQIDGWKDYFTPSVEQHFTKSAGAHQEHWRGLYRKKTAFLTDLARQIGAGRSG